jgi:hypothetical protein
MELDGRGSKVRSGDLGEERRCKEESREFYGEVDEGI